MKLLSFLTWVFVVAAALGFAGAIVVKLIGGEPVLFGLYPRSFMSFVDACLLFAIALLLMHILAKKK
jgi:hypothetical protein